MARRIVCACAVVLSLFALSSSQPFPKAVEGDDKCLSPHSEPVPPNYPLNMCVLFDSFHFKDLLEKKGGDWPSAGSWTDGFGGICRRITWGCSALFGSGASGNHFFTQYIPLWGAKKVFVDVSYAAVCTSFPCPSPQQANIMVFESDQVNNALGQTTGAHYVDLGAVTSSQQSEDSSLFTLIPDSSTGGIYLKFSEEGDCLTINRLLVYAEECAAQTESLLYYPTTYAPADPEDSFSSTGMCLPYSSVATSSGKRTVKPIVQCADGGQWLSNPGCECDPGYFYDGKDCLPCSPGYYKHNYGNDESCTECPENSDSTDVASTECTCDDNFYRAPGEPVTKACTTVPSYPLDLEVVDCSNTSVHISWKKPADLGGRKDIFYRIFYQQTDMMHFLMEEVTDTTSLNAWVTGLNPVTNYTIRVVALNGVSDQHGDNTNSRADILVETKEGVPEKINIFGRRRGNTFSWQPPHVMNGNLTGFDAQVVCHFEGKNSVYETLALDPMEFCYSPVELPQPCDYVTVQVRAKTEVGPGPWSDPIETLPPTTEPTTATTATTATTPTTASSAPTFIIITSTSPTQSSSDCPSDIPPCNFDTCQSLGHKICLIDNTGCGGSCQVSSCRVCTAGEEFNTDGCESDQCVGEYNDSCITKWGKCVKKQNKGIFVFPTSDLNINCVPHPCI